MDLKEESARENEDAGPVTGTQLVLKQANSPACFCGMWGKLHPHNGSGLLLVLLLITARSRRQQQSAPGLERQASNDMTM